MRYKALIIDVDGTLVPNSQYGMPSLRVKTAVNRASEFINIGVASGRPLFLLKHIFSELRFSSPSIIRGGSQIVDTITGKIIWKKTMEKDDLKKVLYAAKRLHIQTNMDTENRNIPLSDHRAPKTIYGLFTEPLTLKNANRFIDAIAHIPSIAAHPIPDWEHGKFSVNITHASATKQHGIFEVAKILKIKTDEIIGVGDGGNDFPLLMACGLRVAMGNAMDDLKAIADYIAPSVEEDGVAHIIEKFVLSDKKD